MMEVETKEKPSTTEKLPQKPQDENLDQLNFLSQLLGIKIKPEEFNLFQDMNNLLQLINNIKFNDKKKNEVKDTIIEDIKSLQNKECLQKLIEEKSKKFSDVVKHNGKTTVYHTAEKDELSETMHAFYFCDKSKQIFSDKQAAEYRAMHFDTGYELPLPRAFVKEEDNISSYSNLKPSINQNDNIDNESKLKKKRKPSTNFSKSKSNKKRKPEKNNVTEDYNNNNNKNNESGIQEGEYCIAKCKFGRKSKGQMMIGCDKCSNWYHSRCLNISNEEVQKLSERNWYCQDCLSKMDDDNKKI